MNSDVGSLTVYELWLASMCAESIAGIEQVGDINELLKVAMAYGA